MAKGRPLIAGIELGGTKCIAILARGPDEIEDRVQLPTTRPEETLSALEAVLDRWSGYSALGIASFGPVSIDHGSADYGHITSTPKPGWAGQDVGRRLAAHTGVPTGFHTDVVGAALAEARWGAARGIADIAYVTVGTGIGAGLIAGGKPVDGLTASEFGHFRPVRTAGDDWVGVCPYHGACVEGLAAGPAIQARTGTPGPELAADDPAWDLVADTLGQLLHTLVVTGVPRRIVMGGGVMVGNDHLFPRVRRAMTRSLAGYVALPEVADAETFVVPPALGGNAGPLGAVVLGAQALGAELSSSFTAA
ncbi:ROK family protein [Sphingomonas rubra]|uniref:fructokinase n=1 Tax=Sphingomonas rubra TaxID=634430 RepID=A0A1I5QUF0_9SPHN|nr:ROK family protein [Sphingomonas rubra]SFP49760.1 fructokinase [Sphingomonas rubra]